MNPINSPATTTNHYASTDPTHVGAASSVHAASGHVATLGHPADGVVVGQGFAPSHTTTAPVTGVTHHTTHAAPVTHTTTTTTHHAQPAVAAVPAPQPHHTIPSGANGDGLLVNSNLGGPLGGSVVLGGQCECLRNGGVCKHGAGMCTCRGCTTAATSINPGINVGVSTHQYTAPVGTSGIGGGVASPGVGMAGVVNPTNPAGHVVNHSTQNCDCVRNHGVCKCKPGECNCTNCVGHRKSLAATQAANTTGATTTHHTVTHHA